MARKPKYESVEQIEGLIEAYFESCKGEILRDEDGSIVFNQKDGTPVWVGRKPPTIPGLALALGFSSRQSLYNYKARKEFMDTISRAQTRVEQYTAERLFDRDSQRGAQFALEYGFRYRRDAEGEKRMKARGSRWRRRRRPTRNENDPLRRTERKAKAVSAGPSPACGLWRRARRRQKLGRTDEGEAAGPAFQGNQGPDRKTHDA